MFETSADDLIKRANSDIYDEKQKVNSRFTIIMAIAKRARQLLEKGDERILTENPLTIAIQDFNQKKVHIVSR